MIANHMMKEKVSAEGSLRRLFRNLVVAALLIGVACGGIEQDGDEEVGESKEALVAGLYCGDGSAGRPTRGTLYRYNGATFSVDRVCGGAGTCGVNAAGVNDACVTNSSVLENAIANAARSVHGSNAPVAAPASLVSANPAATWLTDVSGLAGAQVRAAILDYSRFMGSATNQPPSASVRASMVARLTSFNAVDRDAVVNRIVARYARTVPTTDQQTLDFLGVRTQCKEFADRMVRLGGGTSATYASYLTRKVSRHSEFRRGLVAVKGTNAHAGIITAVTRDATGNITGIELTETNWGTGWNSPIGQVPWSRVIAKRTLTVAQFTAAYSATRNQ